MQIRSLTDKQVRDLIEKGTQVCIKIKEIYPDKSYSDISNLFGKLKSLMRVFFNEKDELELIKDILLMDIEELKSLLEN